MLPFMWQYSVLGRISQRSVVLFIDESGSEKSALVNDGVNLNPMCVFWEL